MEFNMESVVLMVKFAVSMLGLLGIVFLLACATPKIAKWVDGIRNKKNAQPENKDGNDFPDVTGLYDPQTEAPGEEAEEEQPGQK